MEKNDKFYGKVEDINDDGDGVIKQNGEVIFVPNTWLDEEIGGIIINSKSKFCIGKALDIVVKSKDRIEPLCPYFSSCGGCSLQHVNNQTKIEFKKKKVQKAMKKFANLEVEVQPTIHAKEYRYRNKMALPVGQDGKIGVFRKNTHKVVSIDDCVIGKEWIKDLIFCVNSFISSTALSVYNEESKLGIIRFVVAREVQNKILITIVINGLNLPKSEKLIDLLKERFGENFGLNININTLPNNVILTDNYIHIYGLKSLQANSHGILYPITNASFMQVNDDISEKIYDKVLENITSDEVVINAYSGAGLLTALISKKAQYVYGIEIVKEAHTSANSLIKLNNITNITNICGDCTKELPKLIKSKHLDDFSIVIDPPRKGVSEEVVSALINARPKKIIYISCNPITLARDVKKIIENGDYEIKSVAPYDMFPMTPHVETLCVIQKKQ